MENNLNFAPQMRGKWNLGDREYRAIRILLIQLPPDCTDISEQADRLRLLALSHSICYNHIPSFYLDQPPDYFPSDRNVPSVIVFDLDDCFETFKLPGYCVINQKTWNPVELFNAEISNHLQRALALRSYYEYRNYRTLYFTSFILVTDFPLTIDPFILYHIPVLRNGAVTIRTNIQGNLNFILDYPYKPKENTYILIPPHEHAFKVMASDSKEAILKYVDLTERVIQWKETPFVYMTSPNVSIGKYYTDNPTKTNKATSEAPKVEQKKILSNFQPENLIEVSEKDIDDFFQNIYAEKSDDSTANGKDEELYLAFPDLTPNDVISELIENPDERKCVAKALSTPEIFPEKPQVITLLVANFLSTHRFDYGFGSTSPPPGTTDFAEYSEFEYQHLGTPQVCVLQDRSVIKVDSTRVVFDWDENLYRPISGPKSASFVVFYDKQFTENDVRTFFNQLKNIYTSFNFGELFEYPKGASYFSCTPEQIPQAVETFFKQKIQTQFQNEPLMTFIVGDPIFSADFNPHSIVSYIRPSAIHCADTTEIKTIAFVVYSRVRVFTPRPFGMVFLANKEIAACFFGYRYQPPSFLTTNEHVELGMHVCWDLRVGLTAWVDEIGAVMHVLPVSNIDRLFQFLREQTSLFNTSKVRITISILAEGISKPLLDELKMKSMQLNLPITVFSVYPSATIQVSFKEDFKDDVIVYCDVEYVEEVCPNPAKPYATCFVVSKQEQPYSISLFTESFDPRMTLFDYAQNMSHLSWLSVKPTMEGRTISYPPHMMALLRKGNGPVAQISQLEFLPSKEKI